MSELDEKIAHIENLLKTIKAAKGYQEQFDKLYGLLSGEYQRETQSDTNPAYGSYAWNLDITLSDQAEMFREYRFKKRTSNRDKASFYSDFILHFTLDVEKHLSNLKHVPNPPTKE
jgi:hypothetical protein